MNYDPIEKLLDDAYESRARWERKEWATTPRAMGAVAMGGSGIDDALDALNEYWRIKELSAATQNNQEIIKKFDEVFYGRQD